MIILVNLIVTLVIGGIVHLALTGVDFRKLIIFLMFSGVHHLGSRSGITNNSRSTYGPIT